jgi:hypothetical protein
MGVDSDFQDLLERSEYTKNDRGKSRLKRFAKNFSLGNDAIIWSPFSVMNIMEIIGAAFHIL